MIAHENAFSTVIGYLKGKVSSKTGDYSLAYCAVYMYKTHVIIPQITRVTK